MTTNADELMRLRAAALYTYDPRGRMLLSNEPREDGRRPAERLWLGWTADGYVLRLRADVPGMVAVGLDEIVARASVPDLPTARPAVLNALREALAPVTGEGGGPAYRFPAALVPPSDVVRLTADNRDLARDTFPWLPDEVGDWQPCYAVVRDGAAVSICFSSRVTPEAHEAGLETLPAFRGRGFAAAATLAWGAAVQALGRTPFYSTGWDNLASQAVARRIGLVMFGADATFS
jgi:hypothetical protein